MGQTRWKKEQTGKKACCRSKRNICSPHAAYTLPEAASLRTRMAQNMMWKAKATHFPRSFLPSVCQTLPHFNITPARPSSLKPGLGQTKLRHRNLFKPLKACSRKMQKRPHNLCLHSLEAQKLGPSTINILHSEKRPSKYVYKRNNVWSPCYLASMHKHMHFYICLYAFR